MITDGHVRTHPPPAVPECIVLLEDLDELAGLKLELVPVFRDERVHSLDDQYHRGRGDWRVWKLDSLDRREWMYASKSTSQKMVVGCVRWCVVTGEMMPEEEAAAGQVQRGQTTGAINRPTVGPIPPPPDTWLFPEFTS